MKQQWISAFDLDHTLLLGNSSLHFGRYLYRNRAFSFKTMLALAFTYWRHTALSLALEDLHSKVFNQLFIGRSRSLFIQYAESFIAEELDKLLYVPVMHCLQEAQEKEHSVILLSSSPDFLVEAIAKRLKILQWKATVYAVDAQGHFSSIEHVCTGREKAKHLLAFSKQLEIPIASTTAYSDSHLDLPLLQIADTAIAVNPDYILRRIARKNCWKIL